MSQDYTSSITERSTRASAQRIFWIVLGASVAIGFAAALHYAALGLTLSHYDARAHLVVSRRVIDSLTPGWRQLGSVWLPLPHLLNILPNALDCSYRTGAISVVISVLGFAAGLAAAARQIVLRTGSATAALVVPAIALANPNVLYLQSTPMTEPLLFGLALLALAAVDSWLAAPTPRNAALAGTTLAALVLTRYEGWLIAAALVTVAALVSWRRFINSGSLWRRPVAAIVAFVAASLASTGEWPLGQSFYVPDSALLHQPLVVLNKVWNGFLGLAGWSTAAAGVAGIIALCVRAWRFPQLLTYAALVAPAVLPLAAFYSGHPFRVRYMAPLVIGAAVLAAFAVAALPRRARLAAAAILLAAAIVGQSPLDRRAPMLLEAQWETPFRLERERVTAAFAAQDDGTPILASMGSLAHYMHETSHAGLSLSRFLHEGNGDLWLEALKSPQRSVRWILIEERAEGGDMLAVRARESARFLDGFDRVIEAGGLALYRRQW